MSDPWPDWALHAQPSSIGGRLRVICGFRFEAERDRDAAQKLCPDIPLEVFRDKRGRWCYGPQEET